MPATFAMILATPRQETPSNYSRPGAAILPGVAKIIANVSGIVPDAGGFAARRKLYIDGTRDRACYKSAWFPDAPASHHEKLPRPVSTIKTQLLAVYLTIRYNGRQEYLW